MQLLHVCKTAAMHVWQNRGKGQLTRCALNSLNLQLLSLYESCCEEWKTGSNLATWPASGDRRVNDDMNK